MNLTELLAFWGAIISTVAITWNITLFFKDKAKIKVSAGIMTDENRKEFFVVTITNVGKRPAFINSVNFKEKNSKFEIFITPKVLPIKLNDSERHIEYYDNVDKFKNEIEKIWFFDSTGKNWFVSNKYLKNLNKQIKSLNDKAI